MRRLREWLARCLFGAVLMDAEWEAGYERGYDQGHDDGRWFALGEVRDHVTALRADMELCDERKKQQDMPTEKPCVTS